MTGPKIKMQQGNTVSNNNLRASDSLLEKSKHRNTVTERSTNNNSDLNPYHCSLLTYEEAKDEAVY